MPSTTDFGVVRASLVTQLRANLSASDARLISGARSEKAADECAKGFTSIYVVDRGSGIDEPGENSNNGFLRQWEHRVFDVLIYAVSGKALNDDEAVLMTLAAKVKYWTNGFTPAGQVDNDGMLQITDDRPVEEYMATEGIGLKVRQTYELPLLLCSQIK